ncbi:5'-methylthioadenosine/adenosylhomocysteine nucleosidase [Alteromonas sp. C1M14]|uniref:5'-methylthioadenosine/adenosylhomocysteine nucleosidase n=1 Tax=Alteromonas sp. C1M14 TaxID=2841567 RepID=UPI001C097044|nr:5'-methylthioadenosine/adenosylhomocysteine nucleosidase [Alteromonas sp. C1M14]MBU2979494.1 5'-methylthioadenosine/adenosylhomocysteine nucleosidase [Alteromonas sp. C1M14]
MKIGILGAMDQEIALIKSALKNCQTRQWKHLTFFTGTLNNAEVVLVKCGIGKVAAGIATTVLIEQYKPDYVVNTGSAGGFDPALDIGDVVIGTAVKYHDVDITHFGYEKGQCAGMPEQYTCDQTMIDAATSATSAISDIKKRQGLICTGDSFVGSDEAAQVILQAFPSLKAVEMEGAAIGQTCYLTDTPFLVIRSLSDIAGKTSTVSFQEYLDTAAKNSAELVMGMIARLA